MYFLLSIGVLRYTAVLYKTASGRSAIGETLYSVTQDGDIFSD